MDEWLMIGCMGAGGILFAAGGTGFKWMRRFVMPFLFGIAAFFSGKFEWWQPIAMWATMTGVLHLGYGERYPYWAKFLVGCAFIAPTLFLGFNIFQIITPIAFVVMFKLSNTKWFGSQFLWKICEFLTGAFIGVTVAQLIAR